MKNENNKKKYVIGDAMIDRHYCFYSLRHSITP